MMQKPINKGGIILGQVADNLIKVKYSKDMTAGDNEKCNYALNSNVHRWTYLLSTW